jgi:hypothetical protein
LHRIAADSFLKMRAYVLQVIALKSNELMVRVLPADGIDCSAAQPFSTAEFSPGKYLVEGPACKSPRNPQKLSELAEWFQRLDGSWGKEIGGGMQRYTVQRL